MVFWLFDYIHLVPFHQKSIPTPYNCLYQYHQGKGFYSMFQIKKLNIYNYKEQYGNNWKHLNTIAMEYDISIVILPSSRLYYNFGSILPSDGKYSGMGGYAPLAHTIHTSSVSSPAQCMLF